MQVKKYVAASLKDATEKMKQELGKDAVILGTRVVADKNFPAEKMFELSAGIQNDFVLDKFYKESKQPNEKVFRSYEKEISKISDKINNPEFSSNGYLNRQKKIINKLHSNKVNKIDEEKIDEIYSLLLHKEVEKPLVKKIVNQAEKFTNYSKVINLENYVISSIASMIPTREFTVPKKDKPKVVALVGPTGVGKTTCIAKLAIISKILHSLNVGLISIDTYRLGALDQLKVFSDVSDIDMLVAYEPNEMPELLKQFKSKDIIFIDTTGRSQNNKDFLIKSNEFLQTAQVDEIYLVMSAISSTRTLVDVSEKFNLFNYDSLIFTKIDEGVVFGSLLNVINKIKIPVMFLANGQVIPDDIISADSEYLAKMIYTW